MTQRANKIKVSIVLPTYNEAAALPSVLNDLQKVMDSSSYDYEIIVVDDGSTDNSAQIAKDLCVRVIRHARNRGTGRSRKTGIRYAKGDIVVMTDADGTYPVDRIPDMLAYFPSYDMVIGARDKEAGTVKALRRLVKALILTLANFITGEKIPDLNSGLRAFKKDVALKFFNILPDTHSWVSTITIAFLANEYRVKFVPIDYFPRIGRSTFHPFVDSWNYLSLVIRTIMYFNPLKIFLPTSLFIFLFGIIKLIYDWRVVSDIKESDIMIVIIGVLVGMMGFLGDLIVKEHKSRYINTSSSEDYGEEI